jgi:membrane protease YdiL (CAAX protease family)
LLCKAAGLSVSLRPGAAITLAGVVIAETIALVVAMKFYRRQGLTLRDAGWGAASPALVIPCALAAAVAYAAYTASIPDIRANIAEISPFKMWGAVAGVFGAVVEEVIFRGFLMARLQQARLRPFVQVFLTALAFAFLHLGFGLVGILCTFALGVVLGLLYLLGRRSLTGPVLCHALVNALIEPWLLLWLLKFYAEEFA